MSANIDSSSIVTYFFFLAILATLLSIIGYIIKKKKIIKDIKVNPLAPTFGFLFLIWLWLGDLTTLDIAQKGLGSLVGLNPALSSKVPGVFIWGISLIGMFSINYFFLKINARKENEKLYSFNKILVNTQLFGLIAYAITAIGMAVFGYGSVFLGFYLLNLYHSTLPLIIFTTFILAIDIK